MIVWCGVVFFVCVFFCVCKDDEILHEIANARKAKRNFLKPTPHRANMVQMHIWGYHKILLEAMKIDPSKIKSKKNFISEWVVPYYPYHYASIIKFRNNE